MLSWGFRNKVRVLYTCAFSTRDHLAIDWASRATASCSSRDGGGDFQKLLGQSSGDLPS